MKNETKAQIIGASIGGIIAILGLTFIDEVSIMIILAAELIIAVIIRFIYLLVKKLKFGTDIDIVLEISILILGICEPLAYILKNYGYGEICVIIAIISVMQFLIVKPKTKTHKKYIEQQEKAKEK
ncbi:Hypothetical protein CM240_0118 [Clostridium bornimense]|uniref:Uncharacterized protein n=1 Tax=Clostridium bornimense TaxID=1216932 RepID=W6RZ33_9CLOT|nr:hypothetical protein [Clostridium bornimense]CDM67297.1 Hypothetical protein CM240_0118 [Clostridium bornimense]